MCHYQGAGATALKHFRCPDHQYYEICRYAVAKFSFERVYYSYGGTYMYIKLSVTPTKYPHIQP